MAQTSRTVLDLRTGPIINSGDVSNLALVLSVEFPTVRTAYAGGTYSPSKKYLGYFNSTTCYTYKGLSADGYFLPNGSTTAQYYCNTGGAGVGTGFSGNFLNFAGMSSIDILRYALTGGDRFVDEDSASTLPGGITVPRTILQRAFLPGMETNSNGSFYGAGNFPTRTVAAGTPTNFLTPFGAANTIFVKSCNDKIFFGTVNEGNCNAPANNANSALVNTDGVTVTGTFKARVLVCDPTEGPARSDMCKQYPDGSYKPVGEVQKNADKVRLASFGYLLDQTDAPNERYGGVLRAPMKFVGPQQKNASGIVSANPAPEWDSQSGRFFTKPLNTAWENGFTTTGVINYLNQFGRTSNSVNYPAGVYKKYDTVGELYYEAIRYFQNLGPSTGAGTDPTAGLNIAVLDPTDARLNGYPIYTTWADPMQSACQRNYALLIGDNNTHYDAQIPGSTIANQTRTAIVANTATGVVDFDADYWTRRVSSFETNGNLTYTAPSSTATLTANGNFTATAAPNTGLIAANTNLHSTITGSVNASFLWAGTAYFANTQMIRSDKPKARVRTYIIDVNENNFASVDAVRTGATGGRSLAFYLAGKYGGFADVGVDGNYYTGDGNPFKTYVNGTSTASNNEWLAADGSTSPSGYFLASEPERLILAIRQIFAQASKPSGNLAGGSLSVSRLSKAKQSGAFYQAQINSSDWSGTVIRTEITFNTSTLKLESNPVPVWDAANILTGIQSGTTTLAPFPLPANRNIVSYSSSTRTGVNFLWSDIDSAVQGDLRKDPSSGISEAISDGQARLNYIRGVRTAESDVNLNYRARRLIMGDSINSAPVLKGKPNSDIVDSSYQSFFSTNSGRTPTVYIGTNDGMLHAFSAAESATDPGNGKEIFAYVPRAISSKLNKLTDPGYVKEAYVDGGIVVNEARIYKSSTSSVDWGTALVSGMGGGAKGLFALDVTSPSTFGPGNVLWEFTNSDDPDMGHLLGEPKIVKLAINGNANAAPIYKWYAMVTSGYNNYNGGGVNDKQALFLLSLEKAAGDAWVQDVNYYKITADNSAFTASHTEATGLAMPGVATGINGNALFAYAGDLQGNLWRFDLRGDSTTWQGSTKASVLFVARNTAGTATQPITVIPAVSLNPSSGYQIGFGTGKFIEPLDALSSSAAQQTLYGIWDADDGYQFERIPTGTSPTINGLITRTLTVTSGTTTITISGATFSYGTGTGQYRGWAADLSTTMERVAVDPTIDSGLMAINSTVPGGDPCDTTGGSNQYRYNPNTGFTFLTTGTSNTQGYLGSASLLEVGDTVWTTRDSSGRYVVTKKVNSISPGVGGGLNTQESTVTTKAGRISWREITDF